MARNNRRLTHEAMNCLVGHEGMVCLKAIQVIFAHIKDINGYIVLWKTVNDN